MVTEMPYHSALRCVSGIRQNNAKPLISNGLRFIVTCLLTAALWVLFHVSRHTMATEVCMTNGVPIETVSSILGHKSIKTTQVYAKITKEKLNRDMENLADRLGDIKEFAVMKAV